MAGNDPSVLGENEFFGYGVDAGTGTLADVTAVRALAGWEYEQPSGANVILVSSGWGDGAYPTFVGYAALGEVSSFVTDFMVVPAG